MGSRYDLYDHVHRGLRRELIGLLVEASAAEVATRWRALQTTLVAHHLHEADVIGPHLQRIDPALLARMEHAHAELETKVAHVCELTERASPASLYRALSRFTGDYLAHLADAEDVYTPALQAAYTDRDLMAIEDELLMARGVLNR